MASSATKGAYWKSRARKWLASQGYQVADMEIVRTIWPQGYGNGKSFATKRDQWGCDLIAMDANGVIGIQVKGGEAARGGTFPAARREFAKTTWARGTRQWVLGFPPRAREPRVVDCTMQGVKADGKEEQSKSAQARA